MAIEGTEMWKIDQNRQKSVFWCNFELNVNN